MALIFAKDGGLPGPVQLPLEAGDDRSFLLDIVCREGYRLSAVPDGDDVVIEARQDDADDWTDIVADPIDLSPFAPNLTEFQFRLTADEDANTGPNDADRLPRIRVSL